MQQLRDELCAISAPLARVHLQFGRLSALRVPRESAIELIEAIAMLANRVSLLLGLETACALSALRVTMRLLIRQGFLPARRAVLVCTLRPPGTRLAQGVSRVATLHQEHKCVRSVHQVLCSQPRSKDRVILASVVGMLMILV